MGEPGKVRARSDRWRAPWTVEQVVALNALQDDPYAHGYTCPGNGHRGCAAHGRMLTATPDRWVCNCGRYRQTWAHALAAPPPTAGGPGARTEG